MPPKKGVSAQEKRERLLSIFHDSADVFVIKDIEKLGSKKGINSQIVKEVLQTLLDDDLVHVEKIGISNYYWAFPSEASVKVEAQHRKAEADVTAAKRKREELEAAVAAHKEAHPDTAERAAALTALQQLQERHAEVTQQLAAYRESDPETVEQMRLSAAGAKEAANRWLDNTYSLLSWCKKKFSGKEAELTKFFEENGLDEKVEYLE
ncbi:hypothetical protein HYH03_009265 [Edaphochlamys debaryana]|uniref:Meiotic nuclear division protein 1 homolog n=1 Tax=Edaphochlamys debaryana TaxID=47281 RepID=A0A836BYH5_9CHLO|nr:hypothetical protein HYH03_009265 [Edaphochlamys debaryana]|eukprot:KAG2492313.1 hypothetical protein HYH03_009265 [Edaphochlamys debaryana]